MKIDPRHLERIKIVQELYSFLFNPKGLLSEKTKKIIKNQSIIDAKIAFYAPKYSLEKIAKVDLSILRLAIFELMIEKKQPPKVIINEAIELAKELAGERSPGFVNAVLAKVFNEMKND